MDKNTRTQFVRKMAEDFFSFCTNEGVTQSKEISELARLVADNISTTVQSKHSSDMKSLQAPNAVVEIIDEKTGVLCRRYLELVYEETINGLRLIGEDMSGKEAQIVFLSGQALEKMHELRGYGADSPNCDNH